MNALHPSRHARNLVALCALLAAGAAAAQATPDRLRVVVHETHFAIARSAFTDLASLGDVVDAAGPRALELIACGAGSHAALLAAAYRFNDRPLHLRVHEATDAVCAAGPVAVRTAQAGVSLLGGIDAAAVAHYWRQVMP